jgi:hypothetical protein
MSQEPTTSVSVDNMAAPHSPNQRMRPLDVPQSVDPAAEHRNDPNYDIHSLPCPSTITRNAKDVLNAPGGYTASGPDGEPQTGSSRNSDPDSTSNYEDDE